MDSIYYEILDEHRQRLLPALKIFQPQFYLAGGTALALQIGHRKSVDFDFFTPKDFDLKNLRIQAEKSFAKTNLQIISQEKQTLEFLVNNVKVSFFYYPYPLLEKTIETENLMLSGLLDIGLMKLSAITQRSVNKDFVDLYFICQKIPLAKLLENLPKKMPTLNLNPVLKSLVYFDELQIEPLDYINGKDVPTDEVKKYFIAEVKNLTKN